jgi:protein O-GlcNAc transferase
MANDTLALPELLARALKAYDEGRLLEAESLCQAIVTAKSDVFEAWHLSAVIKYRMGRGEEALAAYERALAVRLDDPQALNNRGVTFHGLGRFEEALASYERALAVRAGYVEALNNRGNALHAIKRFQEALVSYEEALAIRPDYPEALNNRGNALHELKRYEEALASYHRALTLRPDYAEALNNRGHTLHEMGQFEAALESCEQALGVRPDYAEALNNRGNTLQELRRFEDALASYERAVSLQPRYAEALNNRGVTFYELKRLEEAMSSYQQALSVRPDYAEALNNRGNTFHALRRLEEALASYEKAIAVRADYAAAYSNRGNTLHELKRFDEALASYEAALAVRPDYPDAINNRGNTLHELKRYEEALTSYDRALALRPDYTEALNNRGNTLLELKRFEEALASYDRALAVRPNYPEALNNRGNTLHELKRFDEALASYERALAMRPDYAEALYNRGTALKGPKRFVEALASYQRTIELEPGHKYALGGLADCAAKICDWTRRRNLSEEVRRHVREEKSVIPPFVLFGYWGDESLQLSCAGNYVKDRVRVSAQPLWRGAIWRNEKIKIAYVSADFRLHAVAFCLAELLELHDRSRFEVIGISLGHDDNSDLRARLIAACDRFIDARTMTDREVAEALYDLRIDIAVDLMGHTSDARPNVFAWRPTPMQVSYLGFPGTMGASFIDYIIADPIVLPFDRQSCYAEQIVHLPNCYQVNDRKRRIAARTQTRAEAGLPAEGFVFCCFNNNWKITPEVFDVWMRLLQKAQGSVLWLLSDNQDAEKNLRKEAAARNVDPTRLVFAGRVDHEVYLARFGLADLFLDTLPYNGHATASDALWTGLPVLTCRGQAFAGRVGASLLHAVGLPDLVTSNLADYEDMALKLARQPALLSEVKVRLLRNHDAHALFDTDRFRQNIEAAYLQMWHGWQSGNPPRPLAVMNE